MKMKIKIKNKWWEIMEKTEKNINKIKQQQNTQHKRIVLLYVYISDINSIFASKRMNEKISLGLHG